MRAKVRYSSVFLGGVRTEDFFFFGEDGGISVLRNGECEKRTAFSIILGPDAAFMQFHDFFCDGKPEAGAAVSAGMQAACEFLE